MCAGNSGVPNLQTELNYLNSFKSYCKSSDLGFLGSGGGAGGWGCPAWSTIVYMSSAVFRGNESSNRIELSWLVQDLLNFGVLDYLWLWGGEWVYGGVGGGGAPHTCTHACTHTHVKKLQMATNMFIMIVVSFPSSPCHPCHPHVIPVIFTSSLSSPNPHLTPNPPTPLARGTPKSVKIE